MLPHAELITSDTSSKKAITGMTAGSEDAILGKCHRPRGPARRKPSQMPLRADWSSANTA